MRFKVRFTFRGKLGNGLVRWMMVIFGGKQDGNGRSVLSLSTFSV